MIKGKGEFTINQIGGHIMTREDLIQLSNQLSRFTVLKKVKINEQFLNHCISTGAMKKGEGFPSYEGVPVEIDNTIQTFKFVY